MKRLLAIILIVIGISSGGAWLYFYEHYSDVGPDRPDPPSGRIFMENNHGHIFYIDQKQKDFLWYLMLITFVALPAGGLLLKKVNK